MQNPITVVITGANRGVGFEISKQCGEKGLKVILTARNKERGETAQKILSTLGHEVYFRHLDVNDENSIQKFIESLESDFGNIDVLINNASIMIDKGNGAMDTDISILKNTMETNVYGAFRLTQAVLPLMRKANKGRIINVSSGMGAINDMGSSYPGYRISKTAMNAMTKIFASELVGTGIKVNAMCPGWIKTDMGGPSAPRKVEEGADTAVWLATSKSIPTGRFFRDRKEIKW